MTNHGTLQVPVSNLLGKEHEGFKCIMHNFNHERWFIVCGVNRCTFPCQRPAPTNTTQADMHTPQAWGRMCFAEKVIHCLALEHPCLIVLAPEDGTVFVYSTPRKRTGRDSADCAEVWKK